MLVGETELIPVGEGLEELYQQLGSYTVNNRVLFENRVRVPFCGLPDRGVLTSAVA